MVAVAGELAKSEESWQEVLNEDPRYRTLDWVKEVRKWPPRMVEDLQDFLKARSDALAAKGGG
jgi:hypothetical protein